MNYIQPDFGISLMLMQCILKIVQQIVEHIIQRGLASIQQRKNQDQKMYLLAYIP